MVAAVPVPAAEFPVAACASGRVVLHVVRSLLEEAGDVYRRRWLCVQPLVDEPPQLGFSLVPRVVVWLMQPKCEELALDRTGGLGSSGSSLGASASQAGLYERGVSPVVSCACGWPAGVAGLDHLLDGSWSVPASPLGL